MIFFGHGRCGAGVSLGLAAFLAAPAASAQSSSGEDEAVWVHVEGAPRDGYASDVQVTGTRDERSPREVPSALTVVDRRFMDDLGARRTDDVLTFVPAVQLHGGWGGAWDDYTVRGFRVWSGTTFRNGFLNGYSSPSANDAVNVERIEVVRGPAAALYGPSLPGGSINFVTKRPLHERRLQLGSSVGSFDTYRGELDASSPLGGGLRGRITVAAERTDGWRDYNESNRWVANPVVAWQLDERTSVLLDVQVFRNAYRADPFGVPAIDGDPFALPRRRSYTEPTLELAHIGGGLIRVEGIHRFGADWSLRMAVQGKTGGLDEPALFVLPLDADGRTLPRIMTRFESDSRDGMIQAALHGEATTGDVEHTLAVGADVGQERVTYRFGAAEPLLPIDVLSPVYGTPLPSVVFPEGDPNRWGYDIAGLYVSDTARLLPGLKVLGGLRADLYEQKSGTATGHESVDGNAFSPRFGVLVDPERHLSLYGNASWGFWPSLGVDAAGHVLEPERSFGAEVGARAAADRDVVTLDASVFVIRNANIPYPDPNNPSFQVQIGEATSQGAELAATARITSRLDAWATYAYTHANVTANDAAPNEIGKPLPYTARHGGSVWAQLRFPIDAHQSLLLGSGAVFVGERDLPDHFTVPGYARFDAAAGWRVGIVQNTLRVENVFDTDYVRSGFGEQAILRGAPLALRLTTTVVLP